MSPESRRAREGEKPLKYMLGQWGCRKYGLPPAESQHSASTSSPKAFGIGHSLKCTVPVGSTICSSHGATLCKLPLGA